MAPDALIALAIAAGAKAVVTYLPRLLTRVKWRWWLRVAVVGAGLAGLTAALRLTEAGCRVRVFERYPRPGGLARVLEIGGEPLEAFYHHLFTSDTAYVDLAEELKLKFNHEKPFASPEEIRDFDTRASTSSTSCTLSGFVRRSFH
mgnify:CR=1 FL=1